MATLRGGEKLHQKIHELLSMVRDPPKLRVGFLENATYRDGKPVAMIAAIQDFGAPRAGIPPRPFFRNMIAAKQSEWPQAIAMLLKQHKMDARKALDVAGAAIAGQLRQSIVDTNHPPLSPATVRRKGFDKPLVDTGHMLNSISHEVE
jgi:hypothetical protein